MSGNIFTDVVGSDGVVPIYDPNSTWRQWALFQIFMGAGTPGSGRYIPKVKDWAIDTESNTGIKYRVTMVDPTTGKPTLEQISDVPLNSFTEADLILGVGPGNANETFRVYYDKSVVPATLTVDERVHGYDAAATAKLFRGSAINNSLETVSENRDANMAFIGDAIPMIAIGTSTYNVLPCYTTKALKNNDLLTLEIYTKENRTLQRRVLLVEETSFVVPPVAPKRYITNISLESPFLSEADASLINYPINIPMVGLLLFGVVHYNDGTSVRYPVDGTKFSLLGYEQFVSTVLDETIPLELRYSLSQDEISYLGGKINQDRFITTKYKSVTVNASGAYNLKLFAYPVWVDANSGYNLEWFLYTGERRGVYRVTPFIRYNSNSPAFQPTAYGTNQQLSVSVSLKDASGALADYVHTQTISIVLNGQGSLRTTNWTVGFAPGQTPRYGENNKVVSTFTNQNLYQLDLTCGDTTLADWLTRLYYNTQPIYDPASEVQPLAPNYFVLMIGASEVAYPISKWNSAIKFNSLVPNNGTAYIKFIYRTADSDLQLAIAGIPVYQQN